MALISDAYGGHGGMAKFNRDFLDALSSHTKTTEILAVPRFIVREVEGISRKVEYVESSANSKFRYMLALLKVVFSGRKFDLIVCGVTNLLPLAFFVRLFVKVPIVLIIHGIDAWQPTGRRMADRMAPKVNVIISVSQLTLDRFTAWSGIAAERCYVLPNCVDLSKFRPGPKNSRLVERYELQDKTVILTLGRLVERERYKGFAEVLEVLPDLLEERPDLVYLIAGAGPGRQRLEEQANRLGVDRQVVFTGFVPEEEKADHYRLADAYVMPSRGEGFGIVLLEAMACGVPVVASKADGGREAVRNGQLGLLVDPENPQDIKRGIQVALNEAKVVPKGLDHFSYGQFQTRVHAIMKNLRLATISGEQ